MADIVKEVERTPEMASTRLDLPADWFPMTTILGRSRSAWALSAIVLGRDVERKREKKILAR